jgi:hypothetical protein
MTEPYSRPTSARALVSGRNRLDTPDIAPAQLEIRSGIAILFRDALKRGVPAETQEQIAANLKENILIGSFVAEWGFDVPYKKAKEFHAWLVANERPISDACPEYVYYRGTYAIASGDRRLTGRYRTVWSFDTFNGMQDLAQALGDEANELRRLLDEFNAFRDRSSTAPEVEWFMLPAAGALRF